MRSHYVRALILLVLVVLLNLPAPLAWRTKSAVRDETAPFQNMLWFAAGQVRGAAVVLGRARRAVEEQGQMLLELATLRQRVRELEGLQKENDELRGQLGFKQRQSANLLLCRVLSHGDAAGWWQTVRLDKGQGDGLSTNQTVITADGVVGRITEVTLRSCDVLLVTDPRCKVACKLPRSGGYGIAQGAGVSFSGDTKLEIVMGINPLRVDYVGKEFQVERGDPVVTSGLGGVFPEGLPVGRVVRVDLDESGLYQRVSVLPAADLEGMRYAFVLGP